LPVRAVHTHWSWRRLLNRTYRHSALRCRLEPWGYLIELLCNPVFLTTLGVLILGWHWLEGLALAIAVRSSCELFISRQLRGYWPKLRYVPLLPVMDLLAGFLWLPAIFGRTVTWRGTRLRLGWRTRLTPLPGSAFSDGSASSVIVVPVEPAEVQPAGESA
jgi:ceramide glucosyltransferase